MLTAKNNKYFFSLIVFFVFFCAEPNQLPTLLIVFQPCPALLTNPFGYHLFQNSKIFYSDFTVNEGSNEVSSTCGRQSTEEATVDCGPQSSNPQVHTQVLIICPILMGFLTYLETGWVLVINFVTF